LGGVLREVGDHVLEGPRKPRRVLRPGYQLRGHTAAWTRHASKRVAKRALHARKIEVAPLPAPPVLDPLDASAASPAARHSGRGLDVRHQAIFVELEAGYAGVLDAEKVIEQSRCAHGCLGGFGWR